MKEVDEWVDNHHAKAGNTGHSGDNDQEIDNKEDDEWMFKTFSKASNKKEKEKHVASISSNQYEIQD